MEFLHGSLVIFTATGVMIVFGISVVVFYFLFQSIWPSLIAAPAVYGLWMYVDQFTAIVVGIVAFSLQLWWFYKRRETNPIEKFLEEERNKPKPDIYFPNYLE